MEGMDLSREFRRGLVFALLTASLAGCGPLTLDVSTAVTVDRTARRMRKPMTEVESSTFDEALFYLAGMPWLGKDTAGGKIGADEMEILFPLDGRTADGIVAEARRRRLGEVRAGLTRMNELREMSASARRDLAAFRFDEARVFKRNREFLEWPVIEFRITNGTNHFVSMVSFRAVLLRPGQHRPWLIEDFELVFFEGLAPGETGRWRIEPEQQEWIQLVDPHPNVQFVIEAMRLDAIGGRILASTEWGVVEERKLEAYGRTLIAIRSSDTLALDQPPLPSLPPLAVDEIVRASVEIASGVAD
jgi:hypothetical protein